jgi:dienelactone hydrolase
MPKLSVALIAGLIALFAHASDQGAAAVGLQSNVAFTDYSPLSGSEALATRLLSPLNLEQMFREAARSGLKLRAQSVDLAKESYAIFVPEQVPPEGYSLLVFISPLQTATVPASWVAALDRHGMIFVSAAKSGNPENVFERRVPLALLAAHNILQRYPIDPQRVYIGGMSGGSRVALRVALAYPDVFHGALLHSGSDRIGTAETPLPAAELFRQFQDSTRLVYLTGQNDWVNLETDRDSRSSLQEWCVFDIAVEPFPFAGHELAGSRDIEPALAALSGHLPSKPGRVASCRADKEKELRAKLQQVEELIEHDKMREAWELLKKIDSRFAGLAAPQSVELAKRMHADP